MIVSENERRNCYNCLHLGVKVGLFFSQDAYKCTKRYQGNLNREEENLSNDLAENIGRASFLYKSKRCFEPVVTLDQALEKAFNNLSGDS